MWDRYTLGAMNATHSGSQICVVDDDVTIRDVLTIMLEDEGYDVISAASSGAFLHHLSSGARPSCVLCDVRMPEMNGIELLKDLSTRKLGIPMILITGFGDVDMAVEAMKIGAADFIEKPFNADRIVSAIESALERVEARDGGTSVEDLQRRLASLTAREFEVAKRVAVGGSNKSIARELNVSPRTIEVHRARVMNKMNANNLADLVRDWMLLRPD
jgi:two-component system response regulator FixJ